MHRGFSNAEGQPQLQNTINMGNLPSLFGQDGGYWAGSFFFLCVFLRVYEPRRSRGP